MHYANITDVASFESAKSVLLPLGEYFQVQDDYLDCFGLPEQIGKIGTDIQDNKCSWLIVQALNLASPQQRAILDANYGQKDEAKVNKVKQVFNELNIEKVYQDYEEQSYTRIQQLVLKVNDDILPRKMFLDFMDRIYKRKL